VTASFDNSARIWDAATGREIKRFDGHTNWVLSARFDPLGKRVVTSSNDVRIWDAETSKEILILKGHTSRIDSAAFDPEGRRIISASFDGTALIWNAESGERMATLTHEEGKTWLRSAEFSADGSRVVTATDRGTAFVIDPATLKLVVALVGHAGQVARVQFDREGKRVLTASWDKTARIWNAESGVELVRMTGTSIMNSAAFNPEGTRVVTAQSDGTAHIWDAASGKKIAVLRGHIGGIDSATFSPYGQYVLTASGDKTARIWDVAWATQMRGENLRERVCTERLIGAAQEFTDAELEDPILRDIRASDPVARNPCLRRGPLTLDYWTRLVGNSWRSLRGLVGRN
jgi:WD40 repeat protein